MVIKQKYIKHKNNKTKSFVLLYHFSLPLISKMFIASIIYKINKSKERQTVRSIISKYRHQQPVANVILSPKVLIEINIHVCQTHAWSLVIRWVYICKYIEKSQIKYGWWKDYPSILRVLYIWTMEMKTRNRLVFSI